MVESLFIVFEPCPAVQNQICLKSVLGTWFGVKCRSWKDPAKTHHCREHKRGSGHFLMIDPYIHNLGNAFRMPFLRGRNLQGAVTRSKSSSHLFSVWLQMSTRSPFLYLPPREASTKSYSTHKAYTFSHIANTKLKVFNAKLVKCCRMHLNTDRVSWMWARWFISSCVEELSSISSVALAYR